MNDILEVRVSFDFDLPRNICLFHASARRKRCFAIERFRIAIDAITPVLAVPDFTAPVAFWSIIISFDGFTVMMAAMRRLFARFRPPIASFDFREFRGHIMSASLFRFICRRHLKMIVRTPYFNGPSR